MRLKVFQLSILERIVYFISRKVEKRKNVRNVLQIYHRIYICYLLAMNKIIGRRATHLTYLDNKIENFIGRSRSIWLLKDCEKIIVGEIGKFLEILVGFWRCL